MEDESIITFKGKECYSVEIFIYFISSLLLKELGVPQFKVLSRSFLEVSQKKTRETCRDR